MHTMREHLGWTTTAARAVRTAHSPVLARAHGPIIAVQARDGEAAPRVDVYDPATLTVHIPEELRPVLEQRGA